MLALERDSATASHWQPDRYDKVFSEVSPRRVALLIEAEGTGGEVGVQGFLVARSVAGGWEMRQIVVGEGSRGRGCGRLALGGFMGMIGAGDGEREFFWFS